MARQQTRLSLVAEPLKNASILKCMVAPALLGDENEDLLCGKCGTILAEGVSAESFGQKWVSSVQLLITCARCVAYNRLPVRIVNHSVLSSTRNDSLMRTR
jgi:hypothetical protein